jgi:hypothetical protein
MSPKQHAGGGEKYNEQKGCNCKNGGDAESCSYNSYYLYGLEVGKVTEAIVQNRSGKPN